MQQLEDDKLFSLIWQEKTQNLQSYSSNKLIMLAGQPGCGKTALRYFTQQEFPHDIMIINSDELRERHPHFVEWSKSDPENAPARAQNIVSLWMQKLIELAIENKYNLLLDGTMAGDIERIKNTIELCRNHKYEIEIRFLAVHERLSRLGIYLRYEDQLQDKGYGRFVNRYTHDLNYVQVPKNIRQLYDSGMVDKLGMYDKVPGPHNIKLITEYGPFIDKNIEDFIESLRQHNLKVNQKELNKTIQQLVARMMQRSASSRYIEDFKAIMAL